MNPETRLPRESVLAFLKPSKAIMQLAVPATIALLAKAVYNIVDTAYIGLLHSENALAAVGVTLPLLLIFVSVENIFAAGAAVLAGRQLGAGEKDNAGVTVSTVVAASVVVGVLLCVGGILFMEPLLRTFGASEAVMPLAKDYAFWMFIAALANLPAQSLNCAARAESSVKISSIAVITGAVLNIVLDPVCLLYTSKTDRAGKTTLCTVAAALVCAVFSGMLCLFFPHQIFGIFTSDEQVIELGAVFLRIFILHFFASAVTGSFQAMVTGCGFVELGFVLGILDGVICKVGLGMLFIYVFHMGYLGLWWGVACSRILPGCICIAYYVSGKWRTRKLLTE